MSLTPLTTRQIAMIVGNIRKVFATGSAYSLTKQSYNFLYQASGFIAHYDLTGFRAHYEDVSTLAEDILNNKANNQWGNFRSDDPYYEYMMAKKKCYNAICKMLEGLGYKATRSTGWGW